MTFSSKHLELEKLRDGIYAAIAKSGGGAVGNAGFIDLGGRTLVLDTFNTQQVAEDLRWVAEKVTGCSVTWVINSHWHGDHIRGNQVFKDCKILSNEKTYQKMKAVHPERIKNHKEGIDEFKQYVQSLEVQYAETQPEGPGPANSIFS